jgi:hypothetical protein
MFEAQAAWQQARAKLSWPEKIRIAETMRHSAKQLRRRPAARHDAGGPASNCVSPAGRN